MYHTAMNDLEKLNRGYKYEQNLRIAAENNYNNLSVHFANLKNNYLEVENTCKTERNSNCYKEMENSKLRNKCEKLERSNCKHKNFNIMHILN